MILQDANLHSLYFVTCPVYKQMTKNKLSVIINMSLVVADMGHVGQTNYSTSKVGKRECTKILTLGVARYNIRLNAIDTDIINNIIDRNRKIILDGILFKLFGNTKDIVDSAVFLIKNNFIRDQKITVAGGISV